MTSPIASPPEEKTEPLGVAAKRLVLVRSDAPDTPLAELSGEPVTIGAGPRCAIRLTDAGLRPMHCVVTPTEEAPRVRRWAPESLLNGGEFEEAPLACGDRLTLGAADLLVLDLESESGGDSESEGAGVVVEESVVDVVAEPTAELAAEEAISAPARGVEPIDFDPIDLASLAGNEWAIPSDFDTAPLPIEEGIAQSVRAWSEALPATPEIEALASLSARSDHEAELTDLREQLALTLSAAEQSTLKAERLNSRQQNHRRRAQRLIESLRGQAAEADLLRRAIEDRDETMVGLQARLESALAAGEAARVELAEMQAAHAQELETHTQRLEAAYSDKLAELTALSAAPPIADELEEVAAEPAEETQTAEPDASIDPTLCETESSTDGGTLWSSEVSDQQPAEPPAAESGEETASLQAGVAEVTGGWGDESTRPAESEAWSEACPSESVAEEAPTAAEWHSPEPEPVAEAPLPTDSPVDPIETAAQETVTEEESPWGIEQLTPTELPAEPIEAAAEATVEAIEPAPAPESEPAAEGQDVTSVDWFAGEANPSSGEHEASQAAAPAQAEAPSEPESFIEKYGHLLPDDDEELDPVPVAEPAPEPVVEAESCDDSIDNYMQRLMQRVRGESPAESDAGSSPEVKPASQVAFDDTSKPPTVDAPQPIQDLSELSRSAAPEAPADMDALRQLANHSARSAIQVASKRESREHAALHLVGSVIGIVVGAMASMTAESPYGLQFVGGLMAVLGCGWYGVKTLGFFQLITAAEELGEQSR
ncbi:hypothetical protein MalM25_24660 [Planctomycetes bacterium MalM25]|nr:hypothetical protein MalM25_24660 [Planctomycetes bacterium MalM25]